MSDSAFFLSSCSSAIDLWPALRDTKDTRDTRDTRRRDNVAQEMLIIQSMRFCDPFHCQLTEYWVPTSPWTIKHGLGFHSSQQESCCRYHAATEDQVGQRGGLFTEAVTPPYQLTASYSTEIHRPALCEDYSGRSLDSRPSRPPLKRPWRNSPTDGLAIVLAASYRTTLVHSTNAIDDTTDSGGSVSWPQSALVASYTVESNFARA